MSTTGLISIRDHIRWAVSQYHHHELYCGHGTDNAWDDARHLILGALSLPLDLNDAYLDCRLTLDEQQHLAHQLEQRIRLRRPTAYLLGEAWFCGLPFKVDERVLIPRSPLAELIQRDFRPWLLEDPLRILDLCTGSGCIGIACAQAFPEAEVVLTDISSDALAVAHENIQYHHLEEQVYALHSDGFAALQGQRFDLIVANPPYVDAEDLAAMPAEYHHEPVLGLACGRDGLDLVRTLLAEAADHLTDHGLLVMEVGNSQVHVEALYPEVDFIWVDFEQGGHGVFMLSAQQCRQYQALFSSRCAPA